jgi:hypothetical protein
LLIVFPSHLLYLRIPLLFSLASSLPFLSHVPSCEQHLFINFAHLRIYVSAFF